MILDAPGPAPARAAIVVDAMGGDHGPAQVVAGAAAAAAALRAPVILTGQPAELQPLLAEHQEVAGLLQLVPAEDAIAMDEGALASWRRPRSSMAVACQVIRRGQAAALVSAGSTGGIVATARLRLRSVPGLLRPGSRRGAADQPEAHPAGRCGRHRRPEAGDAAAVRAAWRGLRPDRAYGIAEPRVGLLNIGTEPGKGNKLARRAYELLNAPPPHGALPIKFAGNVEGGDLLAGRVDVIVTDGFSGNVALKTAGRRHPVRRRPAALGAGGLAGRPGSARCCSAGRSASCAAGWTRKATVARRCSAWKAPW